MCINTIAKIKPMLLTKSLSYDDPGIRHSFRAKTT